ncbi:MAG: helix-turn-helix domain-containing protein [Rhodanobacteraceae bacterium]
MAARPSDSIQLRAATGYLSPRQAAQVAGVKLRTVGDWMRQKKLPTDRMPNGWYRIRRADLDAFLVEQRRSRSERLCPPGFIPANQALEQLQVNPHTLYLWLKTGHLPGKQMASGSWYVQEEGLRQFLERGAPHRSHRGIPDQLLLPSEVAKQVGVRDVVVRSWIRKKRLPAIRQADGRYGVRPDDLKEFLATWDRSDGKLALFPKEFLTPNQAGKIAQYTGATVRQWILQGQLPAEKTRGGIFRIRSADLHLFLAHRVHVPRSQQFPPGFLTLRQAAKRAGVTLIRVLGWLRNGHLPFERLPNGACRIREADFVQFLSAHTLVRWAPPIPRGFLNVKQAAVRAAVATRVLRKWIRAGTLRATPAPPHDFFIAIPDLGQFLAVRKRSARKPRRKAAKPAARARSLLAALTLRLAQIPDGSPLDLKQAAALAGLPTLTLAAWIAKGALWARKTTTGQYQVDSSEFKGFLLRRARHQIPKTVIRRRP